MHKCISAKFLGGGIVFYFVCKCKVYFTKLYSKVFIVLLTNQYNIPSQHPSISNPFHPFKK